MGSDYIMTLMGVYHNITTGADTHKHKDSESAVSPANTIQPQLSRRPRWCHMSANMNVYLTALIETVI
jgi:hypothetical protein